jgi:FkbM family methyltransferase
MAGLLKKITPAYLKAWKRKKEEYYQRISELKIQSSGVEDGLPFIKLVDGKKFFSHFPDEVQRVLYRKFISADIKKVLCEDAINVAQDIIKRYTGPKTEKEIHASGKYYDLKPGEVVVEAGAYIGFYVLKASELVGESGKVIAIEAVPENYEIIKRNVEANHLKNVILINKAVWNTSTKIKFYREGKQIGSITQEVVATDNFIEVQADTIDDMLKENGISKIDFIRIQLNGVELEALEGMSQILSDKPKVLVAGIYTKNGLSVQTLLKDFLDKKGMKTEIWGGSVFAQ